MAAKPDRILLVSPASPLAPQSGAQQRTALLRQALQTLGEVDILLIEPTSGPSRLGSFRPGSSHTDCGINTRSASENSSPTEP